MGLAITMATMTNFRKSFDNKVVMLKAEAPSTFRMPISLVRFWVAKVANPNKPIHEIMMAKTEKIRTIRPVCWSLLYCLSKS